MPATATISLSSLGMPLIFRREFKNGREISDFPFLARSNFLRPPLLSGFPRGTSSELFCEAA
jgi:hypothetical protein